MSTLMLQFVKKWSFNTVTFLVSINEIKTFVPHILFLETMQKPWVVFFIEILLLNLQFLTRFDLMNNKH